MLAESVNSITRRSNDRYLLENDKFRLYYTSKCEEAQNFIVVIEDNFGNAFELEFDFNDDTQTEQEETEQVDIVKLNAEIAEIVARENVLRAEIDKIIADIEG